MLSVSLSGLTCLALVYIPAERTELPVLGTAPPGTCLTVRAPGLAHGAAAVRHGDGGGAPGLASPSH